MFIHTRSDRIGLVSKVYFAQFDSEYRWAQWIKLRRNTPNLLTNFNDKFDIRYFCKMNLQCCGQIPYEIVRQFHRCIVVVTIVVVVVVVVISPCCSLFDAYSLGIEFMYSEICIGMVANNSMWTQAVGVCVCGLKTVLFGND